MCQMSLAIMFNFRSSLFIELGILVIKLFMPREAKILEKLELLSVCLIT